MNEIGIGRSNDLSQAGVEPPGFATRADEPSLDRVNREPRTFRQSLGNLCGCSDVEIDSTVGDRVPDSEVPVSVVENDEQSHSRRLLFEPLGILCEAAWLGPEDPEQCSPQDPEIERGTGRFQIEKVVLRGFPDQAGTVRTDLPRSGDPRADECPITHECRVVCRRKRGHLWSRPNKGHPAGNEKPGLREFVEMLASDELSPPRRGVILKVVLVDVGGDIVGKASNLHE